MNIQRKKKHLVAVIAFMFSIVITGCGSQTNSSTEIETISLNEIFGENVNQINDVEESPEATQDEISEESNVSEEGNIQNTAPQQDTSNIKSIVEQIQLITLNKADWFLNSEFGESYFFTITDLNQNGRLELILSTCQGTGMYTTSAYYEVNEEMDGLLALSADLLEGDSEPDIINNTSVAYHQADTDIWYYIFKDSMRAGAAGYYENTSSVWIESDTVQYEILGKFSLLYEGESEVSSYQNALDQDITEAEYETISDQQYQGYEKYSVSLNWINVSDTTDDTDQLFTKAKESFEGFLLTQISSQ